MPPSPAPPDPARATIQHLLADANRGALTLTPIPAGGNNRVYRVDAPGTPTTPLLLKHYFRHPDDPRDRLAVEFAFTRFAFDRGITDVPRPIACDTESGLALYEFIPGRRVEPGQVTAGLVARAGDFIARLNQHRGHPDAAALPDASECCFTLADHLATVDRRIERLAAIDARGEVDRQAQRLVASELVPAWQKARGRIVDEAAALGWVPSVPLPADQRFLSPSDFGFHNAILDPSPNSASGGRLRWIDFEYAGWDDPVKLVCDFFTLGAVPVPINHLDQFAAAVWPSAPAVAGSLGAPAPRRRVEVILPAYRLKWACLLLGDFLPAPAARRQFARPDTDPDTHKRRQLDLAHAAIADC